MDLFRIACVLSILTCYSEKISDIMCAIHTDPIEIQNITNHLKSSSSKGVDGVSPQIVKDVIEAIAQPLATVFNISPSNGFFSG